MTPNLWSAVWITSGGCLPSSNKNFVDGLIAAVSQHAFRQEHLRTLGKPNCLSFEFLSPVLRFMTSAFHPCLRGSSPFSVGFSESKWRNLCLYKCRDETEISTQPRRLNKQTSPPCCGACCREAVRTWEAVRYIGSSSAKTHKYRWRPRQGKHFDS